MASTNASFHRAPVGEIRAATCSTTVATTAISATTLSSARNRVTVSVVMLCSRCPGGSAGQAPTQQPITVVATLTATVERSCRGSPNCTGRCEMSTSRTL